MTDNLAAEVERLQAELRLAQERESAARAEAEAFRASLTEADARVAALGDVLRAIAYSPSEVQGVLQIIAETTARLCDADAAYVQQLVDGRLNSRAVHVIAQQEAPIASFLASVQAGSAGARLTSESASHSALLERRTIHVSDTRVVEQTYPYTFASGERFNHGTQASAPLLHGDEAIGVLNIRNIGQPRPFTNQQLSLLETFASQATIAIVNARLFSELEQRTADLTQALDRQTSLGEVLRIIAASPTDLQAVLDALVSSVRRLCRADEASLSRVEGDEAVPIATTSPSIVLRDRYPLAGTVTGRVVAEARTVHVYGSPEEQLAQFPESPGARGGQGTQLNAPLLREGRVIGAIDLVRREPRPFADSEIALLEAFADQAVIAIENVRLFEELQEANRQLSEASQHKSQFLANMSHELRTPLNAIIGYSEMLQEEVEDVGDEAYLPDLQRINRAGKHLLGLINDILDLSKIEAGRMDLDLTTFDVLRLIHDVEAIVLPLVEKNGNVLVVDCPEDFGRMHAE